MPKYLGETLVDQSDSPYKDHGPAEWAMYFIGAYGQIDGDHHKAWVLDQVARVLKGTPVEIKLARWDDGQKEYRISTVDQPSKAYQDWVEQMLDRDEDGEPQYDYEVGIPP